MKTRRWIVAGLLFAVLWVFVRGPSITAESLLRNFLVGTAVGLLVAYVFRRLYEGEEVRIEQTLIAVPYMILYVLAFFKEVLVANVDVAYRVLVPGTALEPQVILVPLRVETEFGITTIANSITITPGTVTLDYEPDENALYVHAIDGRDPEEIAKPIRQWENYALVIFDERLTPDDPPPAITIHPPDHLSESNALGESPEDIDRPEKSGGEK
jgi:multicomponent Na+:H+ antiporter subunit E